MNAKTACSIRRTELIPPPEIENGVLVGSYRTGVAAWASLQGFCGPEAARAYVKPGVYTIRHIAILRG